MIWLGTQHGYLSDWLTQQWVRATGRHVDLAEHPWLNGPTGSTHGIGPQFFDRYAEQAGLEILAGDEPRGLVHNLAAMLDDSAIDPAVADFYERTSEYRMDCWSEWSAPFRPFGRLLALIFSRRLEQLNVPLGGLDTHLGISSRVLAMRTPQGELQTAWVRQLLASSRTLYAASYGACRVPGYSGQCIKACFPLPNGRAIVIMRPQVHRDGSLTVISDGRQFGDPGFYFVVEQQGAAWARYVRTMKESIHVYVREPGVVRADHTLRIWGRVFLRLHYRLAHSTHSATARLNSIQPSGGSESIGKPSIHTDICSFKGLPSTTPSRSNGMPSSSTLPQAIRGSSSEP